MIYIDNLAFDKRISGQVRLPEIDAIPFRSQTSIGVGLQLTQERSPATQLVLVRHTSPGLLNAELNTIRSKIGTTVYLSEIVNGSFVRYADLNYSFTVSQARCVDWKVHPAFYGYRGGSKTSISPALRMVSQWTLYAKPIINL